MTATTAARPGVLDRLGSIDLLDLVPRLTLLLLVLNAGKEPVVLAGAALAVAVAFLDPRVYRDGRFWLAVGALLTAWNATHWPGLDNHVWLTAWWSLGLGCCLLAADPRRAMALVGRWLIGLVFLLATAWKATSGEYVDGGFFHFSLLADDRFRWVAEHAGGLSPAAYDANQDAYAALRAAGDAATLRTTDRLHALAEVLTWGTLVIEAAIAVAFLAWRGTWRRWARPVTLAAFCLTTYAMVPVAGFGALLVTLEIPDDRLHPRWRGLFVVGFAAIALWTPLWRLLFYR